MKQTILNNILKNDELEFFKISTSRKTPKKINRLDLIIADDPANSNIESDLADSYYIYSYDPVDDPVLRGSCAEFKTRVKIDRQVLRDMKIEDIESRYPQNLVITASQEMRSKMLIPSNLGRECDINNHTYCILERIGRSRYFGETTSGKYSLNDFSNLDSKLLHYHRRCLLKNELVKRQSINLKIGGKTCQTQIFHLPNYFVLMHSTSTLRIEKLFYFLKDKPNHIASMEEVRNLFNLKPKSCLTFIRSRPKLFLTAKSPYREVYPQAPKEEYAFKNDKEKVITIVKLIDPDFDFLSLYANCEENEPPEEDGFLDCSNQKIRTSLLHQIAEKIEESGQEGLKQSELAKMLGMTKLNARACMRKVQKMKDIAFYMKDEGRQRSAS
jgi:general transcription factor 3C polypeptide 1